MPMKSVCVSAAQTGVFKGTKFFKFLLSVFLLLIVQTTSEWILNFRLEMIGKCLIIALVLSWVPYIRFGNVNKIVVVILAGIVILQSGLNIEAKGFSRVAIAIVILASLLQVKIRYLSPLLALCFLLFLQFELNSRTLLLVLLLTAFQYALLSVDRRLLIIKMTPVLLIAGFFYIGYSFAGGSDLIHASRSNVGRSTMLFAVLSGLNTYPFGFPTLELYDAQIETLAAHLFEADYRDPHNIYLSAAAWGGFPLLVYFYICFWRFVSWVSSRSPRRIMDCFLISALAVYLSTSTLSLNNFIFLILLLVSIAWRIRMQNNKLSNHCREADINIQT